MIGSSVRAMLFDAGNTLIRINYAAIATELARHGATVEHDAIQRADWLARVRLDVELLAPAAITISQRDPRRVPLPPPSTEDQSAAGRYFRFVLETLGVADASMVAKLEAWRRGYNAPVGFWNVADPEADAALTLARESGLAVAVISNSNGSVRSILESLGLTRHLDFVIDSFEVGVEKPDPRIFRLALERMNVRPDEAVYVGDIYSVDVVGARAAGLDAILLDPGSCWGQRDCPTASGVLDAVRLVLKRGVYDSGSVTNG